MIVYRYLIKEVFQALLVVTFILLLIFLSQQLVHYMSYAVSGKIAPQALLQITGFLVPWLLGFLLPLALYFAILLTFGRLYADNELRVLHASGFSMIRLFGITAVLAVSIALIVMILMFWINPFIAANRQEIIANQSIDSLISTVLPGRFKVLQNGQRVIYVESINHGKHQATNVFMAEKNSSKTIPMWTVLSADRAYSELRNNADWIVAENGYRYKGVPGEQNYQMIQFGRYRVRIPELTHFGSSRITEAIPTRELLQNYTNPINAAEFQWRCSIPLSVMLLALLAVIFSRVAPRRGRYTMLLPGMLIYIIYMNLLFVARHLVEQHTISSMLGLWWVHILFGIILFFGIVWRTKNI